MRSPEIFSLVELEHLCISLQGSLISSLYLCESSPLQESGALLLHGDQQQS